MKPVGLPVAKVRWVPTKQSDIRIWGADVDLAVASQINHLVTHLIPLVLHKPVPLIMALATVATRA